MEKLTPQQAWYQRNRAKVLQQKRERYASDPIYAETKRKQALARYFEKKGACPKTDVPPTLFSPHHTRCEPSSEPPSLPAGEPTQLS